jgi:hypothetical protein
VAEYILHKEEPMSDQPLFQNMDEEERIYAPEQLPPEEQARVRADEGRVGVDQEAPPLIAPVGNVGNTASAATPAPGDEAAPLNARTTDPDIDPANQIDPDRQ